MIKFLADTNIFIRIFIQDNLGQTASAQKYLDQAKVGKIKLKVISELMPEIEYVLRKVYKIKREEIVDKLLLIIEASYIDIEKRDEWEKSIKIYKNNNIDLIDAFLYTIKLRDDMKILTFDKDFKKIKSSFK